MDRNRTELGTGTARGRTEAESRDRMLHPWERRRVAGRRLRWTDYDGIGARMWLGQGVELRVSGSRR